MSNPINLIEGSLNIRRDSSPESSTTPRYRLLFAGYQEFKAGEQPSKQIVGDEALEVFLLSICVAPGMARHWVSKLKNAKSISIPNVTMPAQFMGDFESPRH